MGRDDSVITPQPSRLMLAAQTLNLETDKLLYGDIRRKHAVDLLHMHTPAGFRRTDERSLSESLWPSERRYQQINEGGKMCLLYGFLS